MKQSRIEPPLNNEGTPRYYNDERNQVDKSPSYEKQYKNEPDDDETAYEDGVDERPIKKEVEYIDDDYDY